MKPDKPLSLDSVAADLLASAKKILSGEIAYFLIYHSETERLQFQASDGLDSNLFTALNFFFGEGIEGWVARERAPLVLNEPAKDPRFQLPPALRTIQSLVSLPVLYSRKLVGVLTVGKFSPSHFPPTAVNELQRCVNEAAPLIAHELMGEHSTEQTRELSALMRLIHLASEVSALTQNSNQFKETIAREFPSLIGVDAARIWTFADGKQPAYCQLISTQGNLNHCPALKTNYPVIANRLPNYAACPFIQKKSGAVACIPILSPQPLGMILAESSDASFFHEEKNDFYMALANQIALIFERFNAVEKLHSRIRELSILYDLAAYELTAVLSSTDSLEETLDFTKNVAARLLHCDQITITLPNNGKEKMKSEKKNLKNSICAPLIIEGKRLGMICAGAAAQSREFSGEDEKILSLIASRAAMAIENAHLHQLERGKARTLIKTNKELLAQADELEQKSKALRALNRDVEEAILEKNNLETILRQMGDGVITVDAHEKIIAFNDAAEKITGLRAQDVLGCVYEEILPKTGALQKHDVKEESVLRKPDGSERNVSIVSSFVKNETGRPLGWVMILHDITEEKRQDQMKSDFLSMASHDLRTPLTAIKGYASALLDYEDRMDPDSRRESLRAISSEMDRFARLLDNLLHQSRLEAGYLSSHPVPFNLQEMAEKVANVLKMSTAKHHFVFNFPNDYPQVFGDPDQTQQVLNNLISNAIKYSPTGGDIRIQGSADKDAVALSVIDQGMGIAPEELPKIFERFHRISSKAARSVAGTGLGLYISKCLVEAQGGKLWVESKLGEGSAFSFSLPKAQNPA